MIAFIYWIESVSAFSWLLAGLTGACGSDSEGGGGGGEDAAAAVECGGSGGTTVDMKTVNFVFEPDQVSAPAGGQVTVNLTNEDDVPHTFTIEDTECDTGNVDKGKSKEVSFTMPETEVEFICTIHPDMKGTLVPE